MDLTKDIINSIDDALAELEELKRNLLSDDPLSAMENLSQVNFALFCIKNMVEG